jgi:hypothetical protein
VGSRYVAFVEASEGLLLGGVKEHRSIPFDSKADAEQWLATVVAANRAAGRKVGPSGVVTRFPKPCRA